MAMKKLCGFFMVALQKDHNMKLVYDYVGKIHDYHGELQKIAMDHGYGNYWKQDSIEC